jgi:hypothetical protein
MNAKYLALIAIVLIAGSSLSPQFLLNDFFLHPLSFSSLARKPPPGDGNREGIGGSRFCPENLPKGIVSNSDFLIIRQSDC